jgi:hypothetical protein
MPDLPWLLGLFEYLKSFKQDFSLTFPISHLTHRPTIRIFNGSRSGDADSPMKFIGGCEDNG